jgi:hypothetical protein
MRDKEDITIYTSAGWKSMKNAQVYTSAGWKTFGSGTSGSAVYASGDWNRIKDGGGGGTPSTEVVFSFRYDTHNFRDPDNLSNPTTSGSITYELLLTTNMALNGGFGVTGTGIPAAGTLTQIALGTITVLSNPSIIEYPVTETFTASIPNDQTFPCRLMLRFRKPSTVPSSEYSFAYLDYNVGAILDTAGSQYGVNSQFVVLAPSALGQTSGSGQVNFRYNSLADIVSRSLMDSGSGFPYLSNVDNLTHT